MERKTLSKSNFTTLFLKSLLVLSILTLIILAFHLYHKGVWRDILLYYKYFFDIKRLKLFIISFGPYAALMFLFLQFLQVLLAPIPGEVTGFVGGLLFGKVMGTILSEIGLLAGSLAAFGLSRIFGVKLVQQIVKKKSMERFDHFVTHKGLHITFIFFLIPGFPKDSLCYLLGLTHMRYLDFIIMNVFGRLPGTLLLAWQGNAIRNQNYQEFFFLLVGTVIFIFALYLTRNYTIKFLSHYMHVIVGKMRRPK